MNLIIFNFIKTAYLCQPKLRILSISILKEILKYISSHSCLTSVSLACVFSADYYSIVAYYFNIIPADSDILIPA